MRAAMRLIGIGLVVVLSYAIGTAGEEPTATQPDLAPATTEPAAPTTTEPVMQPWTRPVTPPATQQATSPAFTAEKAAEAKAEAERAREKAVETLRGLDQPRVFALAEKAWKDAGEAEGKAEWRVAVALYELAQVNYDAARDLAGALADLAAARTVWKKAIDAADAALLTKFTAEAFADLKKSIVQAVDLTAEDPAKAKGLYQAAVTRLAELLTEANGKEKAERVAVATRNLERLLESKNWVAGMAAIRALTDLAPDSEALPDLKKRLQDLTPPPRIAVNLGGNVKMEMVLVLPGEFTQGSPPGEAGRDDDEGPPRLVRLTRPFYLGVSEVSQVEYQKMMFDNPSFYKGDDRPVVNVSYRDALIFLKRLTDDARANGHLKASESYRLATEAEWEYAARAGTQTAYGFGDDPKDLSDYAWFGRDEKEGPGPVGKKKANAFGLYDLHGNVWEWCQDFYEKKYPVADPEAGTVLDPAGPEIGAYRAQRGGSWRDKPDLCRSASRKGGWATANYEDVGFRVLKTIAGPWDAAETPQP